MSEKFELRSDFEPAGDQPGAISELVAGVQHVDQAAQQILAHELSAQGIEIVDTPEGPKWRRV